MSDSAQLEKELILLLKKANTTTIDDKSAISILSKASKHAKKKKWDIAAYHYAALANVLQKDPDLSLRTARAYQRAKDLKASARWFLETAERYANQLHTAKALAALRIYIQLNPEDKENPKRIYNLCLQHGVNSPPPTVFVTEEDQAGSKLFANRLFKTFDSTNFDTLLNGLTYRKLKDKEILTHMGDKATSLFIIISGTIEGYLTFNNKRTYLGDVHEDDICGETAYFTGGRRTAEFIAKGSTEVFELPYLMLDTFKQKLPTFNKSIEELYRTRMLIKQLALTSVFESVTPQCREYIASKMRAVKVPAGETMFKQGDKTLDLYLVCTGKLAVTINIKGNERLLKTIENGGIVGEMAITANYKRTATVRTISDCILMKINGMDYANFYKKCPALQKTLNEIKKVHINGTLDLMKNN